MVETWPESQRLALRKMIAARTRRMSWVKAEDRDDLEQDALIRLLKIPEPTDPGPYLQRVVRAVVVDLARKEGKKRERTLPLAEWQADPRSEEQIRDVDDRISGMAMDGSIPRDVRLILVLGEWIGFSDAEVADLTGRTVGSVRKARQRVRYKLAS
jgi:DNA-directed RNA polymerase specialized sigma24 family protein